MLEAHDLHLNTCYRIAGGLEFFGSSTTMCLVTTSWFWYMNYQILLSLLLTCIAALTTLSSFLWDWVRNVFPTSQSKKEKDKGEKDDKMVLTPNSTFKQDYTKLKVCTVLRFSFHLRLLLFMVPHMQINPNLLGPPYSRNGFSHQWWPTRCTYDIMWRWSYPETEKTWNDIFGCAATAIFAEFAVQSFAF